MCRTVRGRSSSDRFPLGQGELRGVVLLPRVRPRPLPVRDDGGSHPRVPGVPDRRPGLVPTALTALGHHYVVGG